MNKKSIIIVIAIACITAVITSVCVIEINNALLRKRISEAADEAFGDLYSDTSDESDSASRKTLRM